MLTVTKQGLAGRLSTTYMDINEKAGERSNIRMYILWNGTIPFIARGQDKKKRFGFWSEHERNSQEFKAKPPRPDKYFFQSL